MRSVRPWHLKPWRSVANAPSAWALPPGGAIAEARSRETRRRVSVQRVPIRHKPCFHDLYHQEGLIVAGARRSIPTVTRLKVPPRGVAGCRVRLAVHEQERDPPRTRVPNRRLKEIEGSGSPAAAHDSRHAPFKSGSFEELRPGAAEEACKVLVSISAAFDVDHRAHQRLPPSSPELQSSPRLYLSNQAFSRFPSRRSNRDSPFSFSQTMTLDGWSDRASTSTREWVVTTICVLRDASTSSFAAAATTSGCRPSSGSSNAISGGGEGCSRIASRLRCRSVPSERSVAGICRPSRSSRSLRRRKTDATIVGEPTTKGLDVDHIPPLCA